MIMTIRKKILAFLSILISTFLIFFLLSKINLQDIKTIINHSDKIFLLFSILITLFIPIASAIRWKSVIKAQRINLSIFTAIRAVLMSNVLNSFLPSKGGDIVKAIYLKKNGISIGLGTVVLERMIDLFVLGILGIIGSFFSDTIWGLVIGLFLIFFVTIVLLILIIFPLNKFPINDILKSKVNNFLEVFSLWIKNPSAIVMTFLSSCVVWFCAGCSVVFLCIAFNAGVNIGYSLSIFPLCILAGLFPLSVSGIGTRDAAFVHFFMLAGVSIEVATMIGIGYTILAYWLLSLISFPIVAVNTIKILKNR